MKYRGEKMKRRLKVEVIIDYDEFMEVSGVEPEKKAFCNKKEQEAISKLANTIHKEIPFVKEISYCIEDLTVVPKYENYERSNKMGSVCSVSRTYK